MNKYNEADKLVIVKMVEWVNQQDVFWLSQFRKEFGAENADSRDPMNAKIEKIIRELKGRNDIQCCEVKGSQRQYIRMGRIDFSKLKIGKV